MPADATSAAEPVPDYAAALTGDVRGAARSASRARCSQGIDADVARAIDAALDVLQARGATLVDIELPHAQYATPVYYLVSDRGSELEPRALRRRRATAFARPRRTTNANARTTRDCGAM